MKKKSQIVNNRAERLRSWVPPLQKTDKMKENKIITERNINLIKHWIESNEFGLITAFKNVIEDSEQEIALHII